jgi:hypothetical protein
VRELRARVSLPTGLAANPKYPGACVDSALGAGGQTAKVMTPPSTTFCPRCRMLVIERRELPGDTIHPVVNLMCLPFSAIWWIAARLILGKRRTCGRCGGAIAPSTSPGI